MRISILARFFLGTKYMQTRKYFANFVRIILFLAYIPVNSNPSQRSSALFLRKKKAKGLKAITATGCSHAYGTTTLYRRHCSINGIIMRYRLRLYAKYAIGKNFFFHSRTSLKLNLLW